MRRTSRLPAASALFAAFALITAPIATAGPASYEDEKEFCDVIYLQGHLDRCTDMLTFGYGVWAAFDRGDFWKDTFRKIYDLKGKEGGAIYLGALINLCPWNSSKDPSDPASDPTLRRN